VFLSSARLPRVPLLKVKVPLLGLVVVVDSMLKLGVADWMVVFPEIAARVTIKPVSVLANGRK